MDLGKKINQLWRLFVTILGFIIFAVFGILLKFPLLFINLRKEKDIELYKKARRFVTGTWRIFLFLMIKLGCISAEFFNFKQLGRKGQIIIANHPSLLDVVFILSKVPESNCIVKKDLLKNPTMNSQIRACSYILNENLNSIDDIKSILDEECILLFPEGTRTPEDGIIKFNRAAIHLALKTAQVITLVLIKMDPPNYKKHQAWYKIPPKKPHYKFIVTDDIDPKDWLKDNPSPIAARKLHKYLENYFYEELANERSTYGN